MVWGKDGQNPRGKDGENLHAELKRHEAGLKRLMQEDPIDEAAIQAQTETVASARVALETANSSMMLSIRKVLSREQWAELEEEFRQRPYIMKTGPNQMFKEVG